MNRAATIALTPLSLLYGAAVKARTALYRNGILKTHPAPVPVISVGNITTGGTGKTPLVEWIANELAKQGKRVCVLTRGYRRANPGERVLVSDGQHIAADVERTGDEAIMLAQSLLGKAAVVCDADRVAGAHWAIKNLSADVLILDDAFQHVRIARDLDIVTVDATNPWGNQWLLPAGILRETISSLGRAGVIIITRGGDAESAGVREEIRRVTSAPIYMSKTVLKRIAAIDSPAQPLEIQTIRHQPIAAFCGIGNPAALFQQLRDEGFDLRTTEVFRDHHAYSQRDIDRVTQRASDTGAQALLTTAKDAVKLGSMRFILPCYAVEIEIEISETAELLALIDRATQKKHSE